MLMQIKELKLGRRTSDQECKAPYKPRGGEACLRGARDEAGQFGERKTRKWTLDQSACTNSEQKGSFSGQHVDTSALHLQVLFKEPRFIVKAVSMIFTTGWGEKQQCF